MKQKHSLIIYIVLILLAYVFPCHNYAGDEKGKVTTNENNYEIESISAFLYFHEDGTFGSNDIASGMYAVINGYGDEPSPGKFSGLLIKIKIKGTDFTNQMILQYAYINVDILLKDRNNKKIHKKLFLYDYFSENSKYIFAPLYIPDSRCDDVVINASLFMKQKRLSNKKTSLHFSCGE